MSCQLVKQRLEVLEAEADIRSAARVILRSSATVTAACKSLRSIMALPRFPLLRAAPGLDAWTGFQRECAASDASRTSKVSSVEN